MYVQVHTRAGLCEGEGGEGSEEELNKYVNKEKAKLQAIDFVDQQNSP